MQKKWTNTALCALSLVMPSLALADNSEREKLEYIQGELAFNQSRSVALRLTDMHLKFSCGKTLTLNQLLELEKNGNFKRLMSRLKKGDSVGLSSTAKILGSEVMCDKFE